MSVKEKIDLTIRAFEFSDMDTVISIWQQCELVRSWNNPKLDIERKLSFQKDLFLVGELDKKIIATAMFGYEGHRGWLNYFAVLPKFQKRGFGQQLMAFGEAKLIQQGCPKLNLQMRAENTEAIKYYKKAGYKEDPVISFGKRLIED